MCALEEVLSTEGIEIYISKRRGDRAVVPGPNTKEYKQMYHNKEQKDNTVQREKELDAITGTHKLIVARIPAAISFRDLKRGARTFSANQSSQAHSTTWWHCFCRHEQSMNACYCSTVSNSVTG